jgi:DNA-binding HxlR family transcriptional regulator
MEKDGLLEKTVLPAVPPHTEYALTDMGQEFLGLLDSARELAKAWKGSQRPVRL